MSGTVPSVKSLSAVYPADEVTNQSQRWANLLNSFKLTHGHAPEFVSRSPGRVNVIGEHIDYSLFSVLPMAIAADVLLAVSTPTNPTPDGAFKVNISNVQTDKFPGTEFTVAGGARAVPEIDRAQHHWSNYFKSGLKGAMAMLREKHGDGFQFKSMNVVMDGNVPPGGGLSSSAAFTTASALAVLVANGEKEVDRVKLTELAIVSEREVGVNSGGMDQSASVLSERDAALFVSFTPKLAARLVHFPKTNPELVFLIAQTFVRSAKFDTAPYRYNLRVVECTLAAAVLNALLVKDGLKNPLPQDSSPLGISLHGFFERYFSKHDSGNSLSLQEKLNTILDIALASLPKDGYTIEEIAQILHLPVEDLYQRYFTKFPAKAEHFKLRQRVRHVYGEALRVVEFMDLLENPSRRPQGEDTAEYNKQLGALLSASQKSCGEDFGCSCDEIDRLVDIAVRAGSYGSRLTGAGWGGCTIHLVPADKVDAVRAAFDKEYYSGIESTLSEEEKASRAVATKPGPGSAVFWVSGSGLV